MALSEAKISDLATRRMYTVLVRGQPFVLSRSQISYDSPNHFTNAFLGDFAESSSHVLHLDSNPELFAIIVDYLSGYEILPLEPSALPRTMGIEKAVRNLARDADYLDLSGLSTMLAQASLSPKYIAYSQLSSKIVEIADVLEERLPYYIQWQNGNKLVADDGCLALVRATGLGISLFPHSSARSQNELIFGTHIVYKYPQLDTWGWPENRLAFILHHNPESDVPEMAGLANLDAKITVDDLQPTIARDLTINDRRCMPDTDLEIHSRLRAGFIWAEEVVFTISQKQEVRGRPFWNIQLVALRAKSRGEMIKPTLRRLEIQSSESVVP